MIHPGILSDASGVYTTASEHFNDTLGKIYETDTKFDISSTYKCRLTLLARYMHFNKMWRSKISFNRPKHFLMKSYGHARVLYTWIKWRTLRRSVWVALWQRLPNHVWVALWQRLLNHIWVALWQRLLNHSHIWVRVTRVLCVLIVVCPFVLLVIV